jgi:hypothetical protein
MVYDSRDLWGDAVDAPDPLIYWSDNANAAKRLLGSLNAARHEALRVPARPGYLILYSLAWRKPLASVPVPEEMP